MSGTNAGQQQVKFNQMLYGGGGQTGTGAISHEDKVRMSDLGGTINRPGQSVDIQKLMEMIYGSQLPQDLKERLGAMVPGQKGYEGGGQNLYSAEDIGKNEGVGKVKAARRAKKRKDAAMSQVSGDGSALAKSASGNSKVKPTVAVDKEPPVATPPKKKKPMTKVRNTEMEY